MTGIRNHFFVISKDGILQRCRGGEENVTLPRCVRKIGDYAFNRLPFASVVIPDGVRTIGSHSFMWCKSLTSVTIPGSVRRIDDSAFYGCASLTNIRYGGTTEQWAAVRKGKDWHKGSSAGGVDCADGSVLIPQFIIQDGVLAEYLGADSELRIPDGITAIGDGAFCRCHTRLSSLIIPEGVTRIGSKAFWGCLRLARVELPASLEEIGDKAFKLCRSLVRIVYHGTQEDWDAVRKGEAWNERMFANTAALTVECTGSGSGGGT
ncbi:MAG: leucine-rich repeat domain-containing protein [Treponema sp.]|nr:leucine-rich repeat domain-containing protein [Treponema sp.]MBQ7166623.1 leucine-rich repeat domain-containing protein [Treponema sp.]